MITIKLLNKKIKIFNATILILLLVLFVYIIGKLLFLLPCFSSEYKYNADMNNYSMDVETSFKSSWFSCVSSEKISIKSDDKLVLKELSKDLLSSGYKKESKYYVKSKKYPGLCKKVKNNYKKIHSSKYVLFKANGELSQKHLVKTSYVDEYVTAKINNKDTNKIEVISNVDENVVGKYLVKYKLKVDDYERYIYRVVSVYDDVSPIIKLNGNSDITLAYNATYNEPGYTAEDNYDGIITDKVVVENNLDTSVAGVYVINYLVTDSNGNSAKESRIVRVLQKIQNSVTYSNDPVEGLTYIKGILIVNKTYGLPKDYDPGINVEAFNALKAMQADASALGLSLTLRSGYRSYKTQENLYNNYVKKDGVQKVDTYSARPGHSEHQTGLAFDVGSLTVTFAYTNSGRWLSENCHLYGFIIRYPKGKTNITGYIYEPWHIRYLGVDIATDVKNSGLTLEEYLGLY